MSEWFPLSLQQENHWVGAFLEGQWPSAPLQTWHHYRDERRRDELLSAFQSVFAAHPMLRTEVSATEPKQRISDRRVPQLRHRGLADEDIAFFTANEQLTRELCERPFMESVPQIVTLEADTGRGYVGAVIPHFFGDDVSIQVLDADVRAWLRTGSVRTRHADPYRSHVEEQRELLSSERMRVDTAFWLDSLAEANLCFRAERSSAAQTVHWTFGESANSAVHAIANRSRVPPAMVFLAVLGRAAHSLVEASALPIAVETHSRGWRFLRTVGFFHDAALVPLQDWHIEEGARRAGQFFEDTRERRVPFAVLEEALEANAYDHGGLISMGMPPVLNFMSRPSEAVDPPKETALKIDSMSDEARFPLRLTVMLGNHGYFGRLESEGGFSSAEEMGELWSDVVGDLAASARSRTAVSMSLGGARTDQHSAHKLHYMGSPVDAPYLQSTARERLNASFCDISISACECGWPRLRMRLEPPQRARAVADADDLFYELVTTVNGAVPTDISFLQSPTLVDEVLPTDRARIAELILEATGVSPASDRHFAWSGMRAVHYVQAAELITRKTRFACQPFHFVAFPTLDRLTKALARQER